MKKHRYCWRNWAWLLCLIMIGAWGEPQSPLPVDQAFPLRVWSPDAQTIILQWDIQPGYYLYKDRIHIAPAEDGVVKLGQPVLPEGVEHVNPILGHFIAYQSPTQVRVPVLSATAKNFSLQVKYQGCAEQGFCYPPETRFVAVNLGAGGQPAMAMDPIPRVVAASASAPVRALELQHYPWTVWFGFFGLGLLISLTPCVLPMIPVLSGLIIGKENMSHGRAFLISLAYVLGMALTYAIAGMLFGMLGGSLQVFLQKPWIIALFSIIFIVMALSLFGSFMGAAVMGCLSTLILSPCATPPLVAVLSYISQTGNAYLGGAALFVIGLGSGVPLLLIGAFGKRLLPRTGPWMRVVEHFLGVMLLGVAIWMLGRIIPESITLILWAALAIGVAIYLNAFTAAVTPMQRVCKGLGIFLFVYAILLIVGAGQGATKPWWPILFRFQSCPSAVPAVQFVPVKTVADVQQQMDQAKDKPVILDFYADWCVSCKLFEQNVLAKPEIQAQLTGFLLLRANITANDSADQALMRHFNVVAPPTLLIFNSQHQELSQSRIIGEVSAAEFLRHIKSVSN